LKLKENGDSLIFSREQQSRTCCGCKKKTQWNYMRRVEKTLQTETDKNSNR
jgi:hypothetical protein